MKDEGWWFQALRVFCFLTDRWMDICDCRVTFATEKKTFNQNCECCCQFSVFEATNRASYDDHLTNLVSATANFCFLGPLAELAKFVTSWNMTNGTNNLIQKFEVNPSKIVSATANFLFLRPLVELAIIVTSSNNLLQKVWVNLTRIVSAEANFLLLKQLAELAMIVTS